MTRRVFLAGEGSDEIGTLAYREPYRGSPPYGVLEALLRRVHPSGWEVVGGIAWKHIRHYRANLRSLREWLTAAEKVLSENSGG